jgi:hypothetical protein
LSVNERLVISNVRVMAGLVPAIHAFLGGFQDADARDKPGHDEFFC